MSSEAKRDYYETLGVARDASKDDLRSAYRKLAKRYHPDVNNESDAEQHFKEIKEAEQVLNDDKVRAVSALAALVALRISLRISLALAPCAPPPLRGRDVEPIFAMICK